MVLSHDTKFFMDNEPSYSVHSRYIVCRQLVRSRCWLCHVYTERVQTGNRIMDKNNQICSRCACSVTCVPFYSVRSRYILGRESVHCRLTRQRLSTLSLECRFAVNFDFWGSIMKIVGRKNGFELSSCESSTKCVTYFSSANLVHCWWKNWSCESPLRFPLKLLSLVLR